MYMTTTYRAMMLAEYRKHVEERKLQNIPPKPLNADLTSGLVRLLRDPPDGEEEYLLDLISNRVPPGVDEAAYVKASFLSAIAKNNESSPIISREDAVRLLGQMLGG